MVGQHDRLPVDEDQHILVPVGRSRAYSAGGDSNDFFSDPPLTNYVGNLGGPMLLGGYTGPLVPNVSSQMSSSFPFANTTGPRTMATILDGSSNTAMWSERVTGSNIAYPIGSSPLKRKRMLYASNAKLTTPAAPATVLQFLSICNSLPAATLPADGEQGIQWQATYPGFINWNCYNHVGPPDSTECAKHRFRHNQRHLRLVPPIQSPQWWRQRQLLRWVGPLREGYHQLPGVVGAGHHRRR